MTTKETEIYSFFEIPIEHFPDRSARWLFQDKENVRALIEIVASGLVPLLDFSQLVPLNRSLISDTLREQESDILFSVPFHSKSETDNELLIYILIEHQSTVDPAMGFRVLFYMMQIWDTQRREWESENVPKSQWRLRPILPIVFYTGTQRWNTPLTLTAIMDIPEALTQFVPTFDTLFLNVKETDVSTLTQTDYSLGWLLTVLQKEDANKTSITEALLAAMSYLNTLDPEQAQQKQRAIFYLLLLILHRRPVEEHQDLVKLVEQYNHGMEIEKMAQTMAEVLMERGIKQGFQQGTEHGETRAKREVILKILQSRFDDIPESIITEITAIQSISRLDALLEKLINAESLDEIDWLNHDNGNST